MSIRVGQTGWTWMTNEYNGFQYFNDRYKEMYEQFLREISDIGYETAENFDFISDVFADDVEGFVELHKKYNVKFENLYFYYTDDPEKDWANVHKSIKFLYEAGGHYMNLQGLMWSDQPFTRPTDTEKIQMYCDLSNKIGAECAKFGIKACFHPHANTPVYRADQIEYFMEHTDPNLVYLCMDTAHTSLAGMDAVEFAEKYAKRIGYVHLKDLDPDSTLNPEWPMRRFRPLGYGCIDFKGVVNALKAVGFDDILCVELDYQPVCNYKSAMISREYIHNVLKL